jgi:hypothetical protein
LGQTLDAVCILGMYPRTDAEFECFECNDHSRNSRHRGANVSPQCAALDLSSWRIGVYSAWAARQLRDSAPWKHGHADDWVGKIAKSSEPEQTLAAPWLRLSMGISNHPSCQVGANRPPGKSRAGQTLSNWATEGRTGPPEGGFLHHGRFATLPDAVEHYNGFPHRGPIA